MGQVNRNTWNPDVEPTDEGSAWDAQGPCASTSARVDRVSGLSPLDESGRLWVLRAPAPDLASGSVLMTPSRGRDGEASAPSLTSEAMPNSRAGTALVEAFARLGNERIGGADLFGTYTFRDPSPRPGSPLYTSVGHRGAQRAMDSYLIGLAGVYPDLSALVGQEDHADRVAPHFHNLLGGLPRDVVEAVERGRRKGPRGPSRPADVSFQARYARGLIWEAWYQAHGIARIEAIEGDGCAMYVAKYSLKGGNEVPYWRIYEPGELRNLWEMSTRRKRGR